MFKKFKRFLKNIAKIKFSKREKFVAIVTFLTLFFLMIALLPSFRYPLILILIILTYLSFAFGFKEELGGIEWLTLFILPVAFVSSLPLFYFLLPVRWLTRLPAAIIFALGLYAILLIENIYNVAAERTIGLLRAASSVGLLLTLFSLFLFLVIIFSLHLPFYLNAFLSFGVSFSLALQMLWSVELNDKISKEVFFSSLAISWVILMLSFIFSFWPVRITIEALFLCTIFYSLITVFKENLVDRLFKKVIQEAVFVSVVVFILLVLTTKWG